MLTNKYTFGVNTWYSLENVTLEGKKLFKDVVTKFRNTSETFSLQEDEQDQFFFVVCSGLSEAPTRCEMCSIKKIVLKIL